jgi:type I restriction enzyme R subunit
MNDYRKKYINIETDIAFIELFFKEAKKDPITNEIGKTIFFCVSQSHCRDITKLLNEYADKYYPGKYQSDFAEQVSSEIGHQAQDMAVDFSNNNLNGHSKFNDNYKTSKTRVCVTVGMMTTGYDCEDLLNICFLKPIVSPSDFIQYKGRGTRKHNFNENFITNINEEKIEKDNFFIFDFFGVFEFFENKFQYNKKIEIKNKGKDIFKNLTKSFTDIKFVDDLINPMSEINLMNFNKDVTKADKKNLETFEMFVKKNKEINENVQIENWEFIEEYIEKNYFQKNNINNSSLSKSLNLGRIPSTRELVELALDIIESIKSKDEIIDEEWSNFSSSLNFEANKYYKIKNFFEAYSSDYNFKKIIKEKNYKELISNNKFNYLDYKSIEQDLSKVIQYCDENLTIN